MRFFGKKPPTAEHKHVEDQLFTHTIELEMDLPIGAEFEAHPLYGLSKGQFDALRTGSLTSLKVLWYLASALIGLFLPDAFNAYQTGAFEAQPWGDKFTFAIWIIVFALILEVLFFLLCQLFPVTKKYKVIKEISKHYDDNRAKRVRSK